MIGRPGARILIVDDEVHIREMLAGWLTAESHECCTAANADEAWELLENGDFALLVCDIMLPGKSGLELLMITSERLPEVAVLIVTGVNDRRIAVQALQLGAYDYVVKPCDRNEIVITVANALERRRTVLAGREYEQRLETEVRERTAEIRRREEEIVLRLVSVAELRHEETGLHLRRMGLYARALAEALDWPPQAVDDIGVAAPMHDIGKIGVSDRILRKPGKLTEREFQVMKRHTEIGAALLDGSDIPLLQMARDIALSHHEHWAATGYPGGLAREAIPPWARLVAVVDVYDALSCDRVYRPAFAEEQALALMTVQRGKQFDPEMLDRFLGLLPQFHRIRQEMGAEAS